MVPPNNPPTPLYDVTRAALEAITTSLDQAHPKSMGTSPGVAHAVLSSMGVSMGITLSGAGEGVCARRQPCLSS